MNNGSNGNNGKNGPPLTLALIGCGRISQLHLQTIANQPKVKLVAVADIDEKLAKSAGEAFKVPAYTDAGLLFKNARPEAVVLCTPPDTHRALTESALEAGAHVLCEKPLTLSVEDAEAMVQASEEAGKVLMMASKFRYVADIVRTKGIIESGILGELVLFENEFCSRVDMKRRWNAKKDVAGGGVLIDNGSHSVDIFRYLVGPIEDLQALHGKSWQQLEVEDTCHLHLRGVDGTMGSIDVSWSIHKENPHYIHIYGTAGTLEVGWKGSRYRQSEKLDWISFGTGYDKFQAVGAQLANFVDTITGKAEPVITTVDAIESVRVIQSAYRAAEENRWEKVAQ
jgi:predicted dehydrogenase